MNLVEIIEKEHSSAQRDKIVKYVGNNPKRIEQLVSVFLNGSYRITQRSAWPLSYCFENHPELIKPHLKKILQFTKKPGIHDAVKRNTVRLLQFIDVPKSAQGLVADLCFTFLQDTKEPIAVRVFAMTVLVNLSKTLPELKNELIPIIEDEMPYGSPAFISRGRKALKELKRIS
jgi:hypothetical protein